MLGLPEQARRSSVAAFQCAAELDQANLTAHVRNFAGAGLAELLGDVAAVRAHADAIIELAERHSLGYWRENGLILRGWALAQEGAAEAGIELMCRMPPTARRKASAGIKLATCACLLRLRANRSSRSGIARHRRGEGSSRAERRNMWESEPTASKASCGGCKAHRPPTSKPALHGPSHEATSNAPRPWNCEPAPALPGSGATTASAAKLATSLRRSTAGSRGFDTLDLKEAKAPLDELHA